MPPEKNENLLKGLCTTADTRNLFTQFKKMGIKKDVEKRMKTMNCFDAHSDIFTDVTIRRLKGEKNVFHNHHAARLKKGNVEGSILVLWVDPPHTEDYAKRTHEIFSCVRDEIADAKDFRIVHNYEEMMQAKKDGIIYVFIGVEGMAYANGDPGVIDEYYDFGVRHGMLTWNERNAFGDGAMTGSVAGLTDAGKKALKKMQEKGMIFDVSHLNEAGFRDAAKIATKPIIASHSDARALCDSPRNLTDKQLRAIRDLNGVVGLNAYNGFVNPDPSKATVEDLARHGAHMIDVMGIDHIGCGFDFFEFLGGEDPDAYSGDGTSTAGLTSSADIPNLFDAFRKMGMREDEIEKIAYKNFQRIVKECIG